MNIKWISFSFLVSLLISIGAQGQNKSEQVLITIGDESITRAEFERIYLKNNQMVSDLEKPTLDEYLELFINYKLKVVEAKAQGLDQTPEFDQEITGYRLQLAEPYLTDSETNERLLKESYERMKLDVSASHILLNISPNASPADTAETYRKALGIRNRIISGEPFDVVARATSDDPTVQQNSGRLGYFTAFKMVYPFESAAFNTPVGEVSMPTRSQFGYHIIKVHDKRPTWGRIKVAHIMIMAPEDADEEKQDEAKQKIDEIYKEVLNNEDFAALASTHSEDRQSARNGGELNWFGPSQMVEEFETAAFALKENGQISEPIRTAFGWHIIKRTDKQEVGTYDEMLPEIKSRISRSNRDRLGIQSFLKSRKEKFSFTVDSTTFDIAVSLIDSSFASPFWIIGDYPKGRTLFAYDGHEFPVELVIDKMNQNRRRLLSYTPYQMVAKVLEEVSDEAIKNVEISRLEDHNMDFYYLMNEYRDGILLFEITNENVWSKASSDTLGLEEFFQAHKDSYIWEKRIYATLFEAEKESVAKEALALLNSRRGARLSKEDVVTRFSKDNIFLYTDIDKDPSGPLMKGYKEWQNNLSPIQEHQSRFVFVKIERVADNEQIPLHVIRGQVIADYQDYLEKKWIEYLRGKYTIEVNQEVLNKIKANLN